MYIKNTSSIKVTKDIWLETGYRHFAEMGPNRISINKLSNELNASRASFYNYFGDLNIFIDELLSLHWTVAKNFDNECQKYCKQLFPDLYLILSKYPVQLQFHIQLFRHRSNPAYNFIFSKMYEDSAKAFSLKLFATTYKLKQPKSELYSLWQTVGEAWYSRLNPKDLSVATMEKHAHEILEAVLKFADSQLYSNIATNNKY